MSAPASAPLPTAPSGDAAARRRPRLAPFVAIAVAAVLALFVVLLATRDTAATRVGKSPLVGKQAPAIEGRTAAGDTFSLDRLQGRWVLVNFFATWCTPCKAEHPELVKFADEHRVKGDAEVVSVAFSDTPQNVAAFFKEHGGTWPVLVENTGTVAIGYGVAQVPESYLVAPDGLVAAKLIGGVRAGDVDALLARFGASS